MAITSISISQDNKVDGSNLMPIHSPLVFIADAVYSGTTPDELYVDIIEDGEVLETFSCIPHADPLATTRQFAFVAAGVIRGMMGSFDDFAQLNDTLSFVEDITKALTLKFYSPDDETIYIETEIVVCHGSAQFGDYPNFNDIFNNENSLYYGADGEPLYVYFYNDDITNILTIDNANANIEAAQDYDDEIFVDYDDTVFTIDIAN